MEFFKLKKFMNNYIKLNILINKIKIKIKMVNNLNLKNYMKFCYKNKNNFKN